MITIWIILAVVAIIALVALIVAVFALAGLKSKANSTEFNKLNSFFILPEDDTQPLRINYDSVIIGNSEAPAGTHSTLGFHGRGVAIGGDGSGAVYMFDKALQKPLILDNDGATFFKGFELA